MKKETVLFWLRRELRAKESSTISPNHQAMAAVGYSYEERKRLISEAEKRAEEKKVELQALRVAILAIESLPGEELEEG